MSYVMIDFRMYKIILCFVSQSPLISPIMPHNNVVDIIRIICSELGGYDSILKLEA